MDVARLRESFNRIRRFGDEFPARFYATLFGRHPELRDLFPLSMTALRGHFLDTLTRIVAAADRGPELSPVLSHLGVTHRRFGVLHDGGHYQAVGQALLHTIAGFEGENWSDDLRDDWAEAYQIISGVMVTAAREDEQHNPPWRDAVIVSAERRSLEVVVLQVRPQTRVPYLPGQSIPLETPLRSKEWRLYSPACAPRDDGLIELHIQVVPGGAVSTALAAAARRGTPAKLGPAGGSLAVAGYGEGGILLAAGSTGLAPLKAITQQIMTLPSPPPVTLIMAASGLWDHYDLPDMQKLAAGCGWLTLVPVTGRAALTEAVSNVPGVTGRDCYAAGPTGMVRAITGLLEKQGVPAAQVHTEDFLCAGPDGGNGD